MLPGPMALTLMLCGANARDMHLHATAHSVFPLSKSDLQAPAIHLAPEPNMIAVA